MKKVLFSIAMLAMGTTVATAQEGYGFSKGDVIVEGMMSYNTRDNKNTSVETSDFTFTPKVGYFVTNDIAVGLQIGYGSDVENRYDANVKTTSSDFNVGVFGRYYFLDLGSKLKVYSEANVGFGNYETETETGLGSVTTAEGTTFGINAGIGVNYFLTPKFAVNFALTDVIGYNTTKPEGGKSTNSFGLEVNQFNNFFNGARFGLTFKF